MTQTPILSLIRDKNAKIRALCEQNQVSRLELFGSATSTGFNPQTSDLDFLVEFAIQTPQGAAERFFRLRSGLSQLLGYAIDLVELKAVHNPYFLEAIAPTRMIIYGH